MCLSRRSVIGAASGALLSGPSPARAAAPSLFRRLALRPLICAHRGWRNPAVSENDLVEFAHTTAAGPFMLELDLAQASDGTVVLMHDATVDRTTDGHGAVAALSGPAIRALHLRREGGIAEARVPDFQSVLQWAARTPTALLMLDIKAVPPDTVMTMVRRAGLDDRVLLLTFSEKNSRAAFAVSDRALVSCLATSTEAVRRARTMAGDRGFAAYVPRASQPDLFQAAHDAGAVVVTDLLGSTAIDDAVSPAAGAAFVRRLPIDIIVTNTPLALCAALRTT